MDFGHRIAHLWLITTHMWQRVAQQSGLNGSFFWLLVAFAASAAALGMAAPQDRNRVRAATALFLLSVVGLFLASFLDQATTLYPWVEVPSLFAMSLALITVWGVLLFDVVLKAVRLKPPAIICDLLLALAYGGAILTLLYYGAGVKISDLITTSAVFTAVLGFALQDTLGNVIGGMALQIERTIGLGDTIRVEQNEGVVKEIRWRQTSIETTGGDTIVIPNSVMLKTQITVLARRDTRPRHRRHLVQFFVDFRYPPTEVIEQVRAALSVDPLPSVAADPPIGVLLSQFKESYAGYSVEYWITDVGAAEATDSLIRCRIVFALKRMGITLAIPAYRAFTIDDDVQRHERIARENRDKRMTAIERVDLLQPLNEEERGRLCDRLRELPFAKGEVMTRQGAESHCMYIILRGQAEVRLAIEDSSRTLATLKAGEFFGEIGLMTGEPRTANVVAITDVGCLRLDKEDFDEIIQSRPEIVESISQILAQRRVELEAAREHLSDEAMRQRLSKTQNDLLARIRSFFLIERRENKPTPAQVPAQVPAKVG